jgi:lambda family phage portal protein
MAMPPSATVIDRLVGWVSPARGLSRYFDRLRLQRAYEAAAPRDGWRPRRAGASANADHQADAATIRAKARALVQNVPYIAAGLEALVANTVGTGITTYAVSPRADRVNRLWADWCKVCDADGRFDWYGIQAAAYRAMEQDGEVLIRLRPRLATDGLPVPLQLQLLEIDWLDSARRTGAAGSNRIVNGIEYDTLGRVVAYWLWDVHPGDTSFIGGARQQSRRVAAASIIHLYNPERPGQGRGMSRLAPVIPRVRDLQLLEDAELARKNLESRLGVLASGDVTALANPMDWGGTADPANAQQTGDLGQLASGGITMLPPGLNITTVAPNAAPGHVDNVKHHLHIIAVGMGVTYEMMTGDMREVNFSSSRVRQGDFRRQVEARQWLCLIPRLVMPVWQSVIDAAVLAGKLPGRDEPCEHSTPKWDYVNPQQDATSELSLISQGLLTISESLRRRGYKPAAVFAELKSDFDTLRETGVLDVLLQLQTGKTAAAAAAPATAARDSAELVLRGVEAGQRSVPPPPPAAPPAAPVIHNHLNVPEQRHEIHNHVAPSTAAVEVHNDVTVPAPEVVTHVHLPEQRAAEAPVINITNQVDVAPAGVTVVDNHPTRAVQTVERDADDEIVRTVTSYERD